MPGNESTLRERFEEKFVKDWKLDFEGGYEKLLEWAESEIQKALKDNKSVRGYQMGYEHGKSEFLSEVIGVLSELGKVGEFAGEGMMKILEMTEDDLMHDGRIYNQALSDAKKRISKL